MSVFEPLRFDGMREFKDALRRLPEDLKKEAEPIVSGTVQGCRDDIRSQYAEGPTGNLRRGVRSQMDSPLSGRVVATAPHTHLYEFGTVRRFHPRTGGSRGRMPAANPPVFVPTAIRWRDRMLRQGEALLRQPRPELGDGSMV